MKAWHERNSSSEESSKSDVQRVEDDDENVEQFQMCNSFKQIENEMKNDPEYE